MSNFLRASCSGAKNFFPLPNAIFSLTEPTKYESASGQVRNGNLIFTILPIQGAIEYHNECQAPW